MTFLEVTRDGPLVTLAMNAPEVRNALTGNTAVAEFVEQCAAIDRDLSVKCVIVTGYDGMFSSGGNMKDMRRYFDDTLTQAQIAAEYRNGIQRLTKALYGLDVPVIAAVGGAAIGAGCDLACMCDVRIAAENAAFAESFVKVGIVPGDGGAWLLTRTIGRSKAAEMAFTGEMLSAAEALRIGLVSRVVPAAQLMDAARELAAKITAQPGGVLRMTKRLLRESQMNSLDSVLETSAVMQALAHKSWEHREAVTAFIDKRKPDFSQPKA
ncbi:crotonase/enoyl-CoA hydratase family protein [Paraburkholderia acidisoli]|uniref:Crotonase/enoyl-CoA hydratase family protein n=1 Tax=Paraburkholderia acidisoli TaxID=2571748 RepID=A0A7Z2GKI2_9BURK|nr:crotonase/enoyl-CoA hydratase family protein [Paraburkholderia acidisoli]QGZ63418.1 crotonase/enoyl-CoA hydratase family protein [Paraburkholderia acidisoli]